MGYRGDVGRAVFDLIEESVSLKIAIFGLILLLFAVVINEGVLAGFLGIYGLVFLLCGVLFYGFFLFLRYRL